MAKFNIKRTFKFRSLIDHSENESIMREAGERLSVQIENRTLSGKDENGKKFAPYSRWYQARFKHGHSTVDLHLTGQMFSDFGVTSTSRKGFTLGFRTSASGDKAAAHEVGLGRLPVRRFLGVDEKQVDDITEWLVRRLKLG